MNEKTFEEKVKEAMTPREELEAVAMRSLTGK
jgi:hypothetical protein